MDLFYILTLLSVFCVAFASPESTCCQAVSAALGSKVSYLSNHTYHALISSYWSQQEVQLAPSCVVSATSAQDVSNALLVLVPNACKFAVRSGGHGAIAGSANIQDGVTIDLGGLDWIRPSFNNAVVSIGPGSRWGKVYKALDIIGVSVPGGRDGPVGVGGSTLGGGFGYFAAKAGFACDNVVGFEVVLANGSIINATKTTHGDLWLALKGGANNFGIVTNFAFSTFPLGLVWGGDIFYPASTLNTQLSAFYNFTSNANYDVNAGLILNLAFAPSVGPLFMAQIAYAGPEIAPFAFRAFTSIQPQLHSRTAVSTLGELATRAGSDSPNSLQQITFSITFENNLLMLQRLFTIWNESISEVSMINGIQWTLSLEPIVPAIISQGTSKGGNVLGLTTPTQGLVLTLLSATFNRSIDYTTVRSAAIRLSLKITKAAQEVGVYNAYVDMNHAGDWQNPLSSYGPANKLLLVTTAKKYDPNGIFQTYCPGGFKVFAQS